MPVFHFCSMADSKVLTGKTSLYLLTLSELKTQRDFFILLYNAVAANRQLRTAMPINLNNFLFIKIFIYQNNFEQETFIRNYKTNNYTNANCENSLQPLTGRPLDWRVIPYLNNWSSITLKYFYNRNNIIIIFFT